MTSVLENKTSHLKSSLLKRMKTTQSSKNKYLYQYRYIAIFSAALAALNTFFIALSQTWESQQAFYIVLALSVSAVLTVITAWQASINPKDKFSRNATALNSVVDIFKRMEWKLLNEVPINEDELDALFLEFRELEKQLFEGIAKSGIQDSE